LTDFTSACLGDLSGETGFAKRLCLCYKALCLLVNVLLLSFLLTVRCVF